MARLVTAPFLALCLALLALDTPAFAQACDTPSGQPVPRFVTLRFDEVRGRVGPSTTHPVRWEYRRSGLPVEIIAETADWRRVRDPEGEESWMHRRTLSGRRAVQVREAASLHARPDAESPETARAEPGAILSLERCRLGWCRLEADGHRGWVRASALWGVYAYELVQTMSADLPQSPPCNAPRTAALDERSEGL
ncbi:SH3 domain-containing protein [Glycocaulis sp.]